MSSEQDGTRRFEAADPNRPWLIARVPDPSSRNRVLAGIHAARSAARAWLDEPPHAEQLGARLQDYLDTCHRHPNRYAPSIDDVVALLPEWAIPGLQPPELLVVELHVPWSRSVATTIAKELRRAGYLSFRLDHGRFRPMTRRSEHEPDTA